MRSGVARMKQCTQHHACARLFGLRGPAKKRCAAPVVWYSLVGAARARYFRLMPLTPVSRRTPLSLDDASAARPRDLPDEDALKEQGKPLLSRLGDLQAMLYADGRYALLIVLQGRDAAGKDGTIRKVFGACNPLGCQVTSFKVPTPIELSHDYLWRVHQAVPAKSMIGIFNRSHYEDVLVVRVKDIVPKAVWSKRYDQINDFER